jgi:hypothetical protein
MLRAVLVAAAVSDATLVDPANGYPLLALLVPGGRDALAALVGVSRVESAVVAGAVDNKGRSQGQSMGQSMGQITGQSMGQITGQSMGQITGQSMGQSTGQSMGAGTSPGTGMGAAVAAFIDTDPMGRLRECVVALTRWAAVDAEAAAPLSQLVVTLCTDRGPAAVRAAREAIAAAATAPAGSIAAAPATSRAAEQGQQGPEPTIANPTSLYRPPSFASLWESNGAAEPLRFVSGGCCRMGFCMGCFFCVCVLASCRL